MRTDCLIIGGGVAGLTAAVYLGRFLRHVTIIDSGQSRAEFIPVSHNYPGFTKGVSGKDFLTKLRIQAKTYGVHMIAGEVMALTRNAQGEFEAVYDSGCVYASKVILATGVVDKKPQLPHGKELIYDGIIRFCPICDGYEAMDRTVGILGPCDHIYKKALFMRAYTSKIHILTTDKDIRCSDEDRALLQAAGLDVPVEILTDLHVEADHLVAVMEGGRTIRLDVLYPAMGAEVRTGLAGNLGVQMNEAGCLFTNAHQETTCEGLYAIGDITLDLSQLSVATGQAAIAATHVHNTLPHHYR